MCKGCSHFPHQSYAVSMRHFFALNLHLKRSLFLRTDIEGYPNRFQKVPVFISQTASPHDYPTGLPVWQQKSMLAFKGSVQRARTIVFRFDDGAFVGMNPRKEQITRQRQFGVKAVNPASLSLIQASPSGYKTQKARSAD